MKFSNLPLKNPSPILLKSIFTSSTRTYFLEVFVYGKGYRWSRLGIVGRTDRFALLMGMRSVVLANIPNSLDLFGINKKKMIIRSCSVSELHDFSSRLQNTKPPGKYFSQGPGHYPQGLSLRFKFRKLQNFRHKKRK